MTFSYSGDRVVNRTAKVGTALVSGSVTQSSVTVTERYDRQGRLYQVVDPAGTATYGYDPAGRLTSVAMPNQNRYFAYDGRGLLTSETHPEKGISGNGAVAYSRYDAMGNVGRRSDGPMSVDYVYDRAGRLLRINDLGTTTPVKVFTYGTGTVSTDRSAGKVKTADRYNYVTIGTTAYTMQVRETYTYGGRSGRTSKRDTQTWVNGGAGEAFTQTFGAYDHLGNLTSLSYPQCTHAACTAPSPRTVTFGYTDGRLTSVPGWAPAIAYHPNGMTKSIAHGNNVTTNLTKDDWNRPRPKVIATSGALNSAGSLQEWTTGTYTYDGSGNVIHVGTARYVYDGLSRLKSATQNAVLNGNALADKTQSYTYDPVGNLTSTTTNGVLVNSPSSATTNRLTGSVIYDAAGNLTSWNGNTYAYDRLGMMWKMKAGTLEHIYLYTADDERIWVYPAAGGGPSTWTLRDLGGKVLREYKNTAGTWSVNRDYVHGNGQLLGAAVSPTVNHYFHVDHLGTPRLITGADKKRVVYHAYYPFGQEATSPTLDTERMKFTGHERDLNAVTGTNPAADDLDYMHARFYNPGVGRFLSFDPLGGNPYNSQSWNRYAYVLGNPLKYVDPYGLTATCSSAEEKNTPICGETIDVVTEALGYDPLTGVQGHRDLISGGAFMRQLSGGLPGGPVTGNKAFRLTFSDRVLSGIPSVFAQTTGEAVVGFGDTLSFGFTDWYRTEAGLANTINEESGAYVTGQVAGVAHGLALGGAGAARAAGVQTRVAMHGAHHTFGRLGRLSHVQLNVWRIGVKGSGRAFRLPLPWR